MIAYVQTDSAITVLGWVPDGPIDQMLSDAKRLAKHRPRHSAICLVRRRADVPTTEARADVLAPGWKRRRRAVVDK